MRKTALSIIALASLFAATSANAGVCIKKDGSVNTFTGFTVAALDNEIMNCVGAGGSYAVVSKSRGLMKGGPNAAAAVKLNCSMSKTRSACR
jgi:hypothetical protein